jgi:hypothetical protein
MESNGARLLAFYMHSNTSAESASLSLLDCYHLVKFAADTIGLMTQCIKFKNVKEPPRGYHENSLYDILVIASWRVFDVLKFDALGHQANIICRELDEVVAV